MILSPHRTAESATEYAYRVLQNNIVHMILTPGTAISPLEAAAELNISRTPLQSACSRLASDGLVTIIPQKGSYVSLIDLQRVYESVFMRNLLDQAAVRRLCTGVKSEEAILALEANLNQQEFYLKTNAAQEIMELDNEFHSTIYTMSGLSNVQAALGNLFMDQDRVRYLKMQSKIRMQDTVAEHKALLAAIKIGDGDLGSRLSYEHVSKFGVDMASIYEQNKTFFSNWDENLLSHFECKHELFYNMVQF